MTIAVDLGRKATKQTMENLGSPFIKLFLGFIGMNYVIKEQFCKGIIRKMTIVKFHGENFWEPQYDFFISKFVL